MAVSASAATQSTEQASGGLPQFNVAQWPGEMIWMAAIFTLLLIVFSRVFAPRIGGGIAAREDKIGGDIGEARRLRDEAESQSKAAAEELAQARARAQKLAADAKSAAGAEAAKRQAEEDARLAQVIAEAEARISAARAEAMTQAPGIAAEAAAAIVEKLTGKVAGAAELRKAMAG